MASNEWSLGQISFSAQLVDGDQTSFLFFHGKTFFALVASTDLRSVWLPIIPHPSRLSQTLPWSIQEQALLSLLSLPLSKAPPIFSCPQQLLWSSSVWLLAVVKTASAAIVAIAKWERRRCCSLWGLLWRPSEWTTDHRVVDMVRSERERGPTCCGFAMEVGQ